jgi:ABC-type Na+ transport system ATPase subunit NatA
MVKVFGSSEGVNVIYSVHIVEDIDTVLDHINVDKYVDNLY